MAEGLAMLPHEITATLAAKAGQQADEAARQGEGVTISVKADPRNAVRRGCASERAVSCGRHGGAMCAQDDAGAIKQGDLLLHDEIAAAEIDRIEPELPGNAAKDVV